MVRVEAAGQRSECGHDDLVRGFDEATAGDLPAFEVKPQLGMEVAGDFGPGFVRHRFVAEDDSVELDLVLDPSAAKPGSWLPTIHVQSRREVSSVSKARAFAGSRSHPNRSWKLSPRQ